MADLVEAVAEYIGRTIPTDAEIREKIDALEVKMLACPQVEIPPRHYFAKGLYAREITIPRGTLLTGKIHTTEHLNIISKGEISVLTEHGPKRVKAPCTLISPPGTKRLGFAHEETVWTTIHANPENEHDVDKLEAVLISPTYFDVPAVMQEGTPCLSSL
jgi:hypothetical protein